MKTLLILGFRQGCGLLDLGWPDNFKNGVKSGDLAKFHPTAVLETGFEILTLWFRA